MGLGFLTPLFAIGLGAIAIPILVHLVHKERKEATPFPSLMFLRRTPYQHSRRQRIRDWLLFLLRAFAFLILVAAFARPVFHRAAAVTPEQVGGREVVILVDQSFSMRYANRWSKAIDAAHKVIDGLGANDKATIVLFDDEAHAVSEATSDHQQLRAAVDSAKPTDGSTRYAPPLAIARRVIAESRLPKRQVVVISDYQRTGWDLSDDSRLPDGTEVVPVDVSSAEVKDRAIRSVDMRRHMDGTLERIAITARISNLGPAAHGVDVQLNVAGRTIQTSHVDLPADAGGSVTFSPIPVPGSPERASIHLAPDDLPGDDVFSFVLERTPSVGVLILEAPQAPPDRVFFLERALEIGDRPSFDVVVRRTNQILPNDFSGRRVIVLDDAGFPGGDAGHRIDAFVHAGGGLLVVLGETADASTWPAGELSLLPAMPGAVVDRLSGKGAVLGQVDRSHPIFALFGTAGGGDFSGARFLRYRAVSNDSGALARFDDGAVALAEKHVGSGRVLEWTSSFDATWNDLPRQPVFLPFVQQLAEYVAGYHARRSIYEVGDAVDVTAPPAVRADADSVATRATPAYVAVAPSGARIHVGGQNGAAALLPREAGVYEVRREGDPGALPRLVAVNPASRELDFARFDPTRLTNAIAPAVITVPALQNPQADVAAAERQQSLWWYLLLIVTGMLVGEELLADRLSRRRPAAT